MRVRHQRLLVLAALAGVLATATAGTAGGARRPLADALGKKGSTPGAPAVRQASPEDRYALAGGCYVARSAATGRYVTRAGTGFAATAADKAQAEPFHFQAFDLGKYLLFAGKGDFVASDSGKAPAGARPVTDAATGRVNGTGDETLRDARTPVTGALGTAGTLADPLNDATKTDAVGAAAKPSAAAEWLVRETGNGTYALRQAADDHDEATPGPLDPPAVATLSTKADGTLHTVAGDPNGQSERFAFELAQGCAAWPEIGTQVTGTPYAAATSYEESRGYVDAHLHMMAFEFLGGEARCGRPWHPYGVTYALVDCPDHEPGGYGAVLEQALNGAPGGHDTTGWPTFGYWPHYSSLTHEQVYYTWLERAWRGGLRMFTNLLVENGVLCELYPYKRNSCNEMDAVRLQAQRLRELERYIDAQSGGPGEGWFRIVTDPFEARRVVNAGKLAVVMGIEVSVPFDCGEYLGVPRCTAAQIQSRLDEVYALGVRQMELTNKFDNALTGVTGDSGIQGPIVNAGNRYETGHFWQMKTCATPEDDRHDKLQEPNVPDSSDGQIGRDAIFGAVLDTVGATGAAPVYPAGPHCNTIGLSGLGRTAIDGLIQRGMIFDPDHMSALARKQAIEHVASRGYSGIVSSHSWADDPTYRSILELGGVVTPHAGGATGFVKEWRKLRSWADPRYTFGIGFGSDVNGFSVQGAPRNPAAGTGVTYPFTGLGGVTVDKQTSGAKTWDFNTSGVDHYGLYPDWVEDGRLVAGADGAAFVADMQRGVEAYLQMWERAIGVAPDACRADVTDLTSNDLRGVRKHMTPEQVLAALGQPATRTGAAFTYCTADGTATVRFGGDGRVSGVDAP
ncbi:MAG TPA: peptidase [Mycobacteriales bacterium]|jgi:hypothetical protein|nr:peptidase [Mycobacteriales bacterium]